MIILKTDRTEYFNDISEEIRLFYGNRDIEMDSPELPAFDGDVLNLTATLVDGEDGCQACATANGLVGTAFMPYEGKDALAVKRIEKRCLKSAVYELMVRLRPDVSVPWGSLTGIRPTKLFRDLSRASSVREAEDRFTQVFHVSGQKTELAKTITAVQEPFIRSVRDNDIDVYVGIPFCRTRCLYCSFASEVVGKKDTLSPYVTSLFTDIRHGADMVKRFGYHVRAIYIGGGTPTVLSEGQLSELLDCVLTSYAPFDGELTVEAGRPDTITAGKLHVMREHGVTRISINPQTMSDETLLRIGRLHTAEEIVDCYRLARSCGFTLINMDLIAGLPGERYGDFMHSLGQVVELAPENLTVHSLAIKRSSRLKAHLDEYPLAEAGEVDRMISSALSVAEGNGYRPYYLYRQKYMSGNLENVGYALPGTECMYNVDMMEETVNILAHGACAISKRLFQQESRVERLAAPKNVDVYLEKLPQLLQEKENMFRREV